MSARRKLSSHRPVVINAGVYDISELQSALLFAVAADEDERMALLDRAESALASVASIHTMSDPTHRLVISRLLAAIVVDDWREADPAWHGRPGAALRAELDKMNAWLRAGLDRELSREFAREMAA